MIFVVLKKVGREILSFRFACRAHIRVMNILYRYLSIKIKNICIKNEGCYLYNKVNKLALKFSFGYLNLIFSPDRQFYSAVYSVVSRSLKRKFKFPVIEFFCNHAESH